FVPCLRAEPLGHPALGFWPAAAVPLRPQPGRVEADALQQIGVELRLERRDRDPLAVRAFVDIAEVRAGIGGVGAALVLPYARSPETIEDGEQRHRPVQHRRIDDLAAARA